MAASPGKRKRLGRGIGDLVGGSLESLVRATAASPRLPSPRHGIAAPAADRAGAAPPRPDAGASAAEAAAGARVPARVLAVASGKGGTGKTLLAANLAVAMAGRVRTGLVDADFGLANSHIVLGLQPRYDVSHLLSGERTLDEVLEEGPRGLMLLPGATGLPEMASLDPGRLDRLAAAVEPLLAASDVVVLDCPAGISPQSLLLIHGADLVVIVTTPDLTAMTDAYALLKTVLTHRPLADAGLVVNGARSPAEGSETYRKINQVSRRFLGRDVVSLGTIPHDPHLERSVSERRPALITYPTSPASRAIVELAERILERPGMEAAAGFSERLRRTLAAAAAAPGRSRNGGRPCTS